MSPLSEQEKAEAVRILRNNDCGEPLGYRKLRTGEQVGLLTVGSITGYMLVGTTGYVEVTPGMEPMAVGTFHALNGEIGHGVEHQLNRKVLDVDSEVTGFGTHCRLVVFGDTDGRTIILREDVWADPTLPESTDWQRMSVAHHPNHRLHPEGTHLVQVSSERYTGPAGPCIEHRYDVYRGLVRLADVS